MGSRMTADGVRRGPSDLTPEELEVIRLVVAGWTDERIAGHLGVGTATVQRRLRAAADALGGRSRVEIAVRAVSLGLVEPPGDERPESGGDATDSPDDGNPSRPRAGGRMTPGEDQEHGENDQDRWPDR